MSNYNQSPRVGEATRFAKSPMAEVEFSRMTATPTWSLPFNAGDIVPIYYCEVLPHDTINIDLDFVVRQSTLLRPTMGQMQIDIHAFWVPNRIINESWKNVQGENTSGFWTAPEVELAPLYRHSKIGNDGSIAPVQIPVGSVADYYGFPTQRAIPGSILEQCNDLKFRGYLDIYNNYFRDQNYQPPIPFSKLNIYNGFLEHVSARIAVDGQQPFYNPVSLALEPNYADGSFPGGALLKAIAGSGGSFDYADYSLQVPSRMTTFSALGKPLKANKLHDMFTSALPSPQKGAEVYFGLGHVAEVNLYTTQYASLFPQSSNGTRYPLKLGFTTQQDGLRYLTIGGTGSTPSSGLYPANVTVGHVSSTSGEQASVYGTNLRGLADLSTATGVSVNELRTAVATQQVYETLARGGSRYTSMLRNFFELETETPFVDIPLRLGHIRRELDLYQVAQTSASSDTSAQGSLTAYGYTSTGGSLFTRTFVEHGYIHIFAVVRQKNIYSTYFAQDNFRKKTLDFYLPQFANIGEQPLPLALLNPFRPDSLEKAIGYQEAWSEYRYEPDRVHGLFRSGVDGSLNVWNYADDFDSEFTHVNGEWLKSNAEEVLNRTLAVTSELAPQFLGQFHYKVDKQRPMPTYSVPGLDTI